jgi:hypothetical protein
MYAVIKLTGKFYAKDVTELDEFEIIEYVESFINEGSPVTFCDELQDAEELFGVSIELIEKENN